jgi:phage terminase large subunit-like protein
MEAGFRMEPFPQTPLWLTPPAKQVELLALYQKKEGERVVWENALKHGGNPVMRWMMANVTIKITDAGNSIPARGRSAEKIDGVAAMLNAIGLWLKDRGEPQQRTYLLEEDLIII